MSGDTLTYRGKPVWASTPRALLRDPSISMQAKALWAILDDHASVDSPVPFPGQETLSEFAGLSPENGDRTIRRWAGELVKAGWVEVQRTGRSNRYVMCWDNDRVPDTHVRARSDRTQKSGRDRTQKSGQSGHGSPKKKNQEEEPGEEPSSSARETQESPTEPVDNPSAPNLFANLIRHGAEGVDDDGSEATTPEQIAVEVAQALGRNDTTPRVQEVRSIERAVDKQGWPAAEVIARASRSALADSDAESYWKTTLTELVNTRPPDDLAARRAGRPPDRRPPEPTRPAEGMSPAVGRQLRADEGWGTPAITKAGLDDCWARIGGRRRPATDPNRPDTETEEAAS